MEAVYHSLDTANWLRARQRPLRERSLVFQGLSVFLNLKIFSSQLSWVVSTLPKWYPMILIFREVHCMLWGRPGQPLLEPSHNHSHFCKLIRAPEACSNRVPVEKTSSIDLVPTTEHSIVCVLTNLIGQVGRDRKTLNVGILPYRNRKNNVQQGGKGTTLPHLHD